jgi:Cu-processing system permease protein
MTRDVRTIARLELVAAARLKWLRLLTAAFALLGIAAAYSAGAAVEVVGADGFARTTMALLPVALILVPLAALILGVSGQAVEAGAESFLFGQPITRGTILLGRWLGECAALGGAILVGFGIAAAVIASANGVAGLPGFALFAAASAALAVVFLSIAAAIAATTERRVAALGIATFVWFVFVLLYDGAALSLAVWLTGRLGGRVLFASVFGNPVDVIRVGVLWVCGTPNVLGAAGEAWLRFLGGALQASVAIAVALALWTAAPIAFGVYAIGRRDL